MAEMRGMRTPTAEPDETGLSKLDLAMAWTAALVLLAAIAVTLGAVFTT